MTFPPSLLPMAKYLLKLNAICNGLYTEIPTFLKIFGKVSKYPGTYSRTNTCFDFPIIS